MAKQTILKERGTGEAMYPQTLASLVQTADGGNVEGGLEKAAFKTFVDMWNARCVVSSNNSAAVINRNTFGRYNEETGFFELNGLTDITYEQAVEIMKLPNPFTMPNNGKNNHALEYSRARTFFPVVVDTIYSIFSMMPNLEVVRFVDYYIVNNGADPDTRVIYVSRTRDCFTQCYNLREIKGILRLPATDEMNVHFYSALQHSEKLETAWFHGWCLNGSLKSCKLLRRECVAYIVDNAANTSAITITVHADVYAKLTGDTTNAAAAALAPEELAQWQQVLADAAAKNISFATV